MYCKVLLLIEQIKNQENLCQLTRKIEKESLLRGEAERELGEWKSQKSMVINEEVCS